LFTQLYNTLKSYLESIKFSHTVFALPFAMMGMILPEKKFPDISTILWIIVAMVGARSGAMGINRIFDYKFDKDNPRTMSWPHIRGDISIFQISLLTLISYLLFIFASYNLNTLCFYLSFPVIIILSFYSLTKRFTYYTHIFLGFAISLASVGAWIAVTGEFSWKPFILSSVILFWIAGFDIFYSLQDVEFDKKKGLFSIPVKYGVKKAIQISRIFHLIMMFFLILTIFIFNLGFIYILGVATTAIFLIYEHSIVKENDLSRIDKAFFTVNGWISILLFISLLFDIYL